MNEAVGIARSELTPMLQIDEVLALDLQALQEHIEFASNVLNAQMRWNPSKRR